jgi:hypothetical protein
MSPFDHIDFKPLIAEETNGRLRVRLMALSHIKEGANNSQTARNLHISRRIVIKVLDTQQFCKHTLLFKVYGCHILSLSRLTNEYYF